LNIKSQMSQKTKSIVEALKSTPTKRSFPLPETSAAENERSDEFKESPSSSYSDVADSEENSDVVISEKPNSQRGASTSSEDLIARLSRLQASSKDDDQEAPENSHYDDQPHRATSRPLQQRQRHEKQRQVPATRQFSSRDRNVHSRSDATENYFNEHEAEYEPESHRRPPVRRPAAGYQEERAPVRKPQATAPFRTSRRGVSARPVHDRVESPIRSPGRRSTVPAFSTSADRFESDDQENSYRGHQAQTTRVANRGRPGLNSPQTSGKYRTIQPPLTKREVYEQRWSTDDHESEYAPDLPRGRSNQSSSLYGDRKSSGRSHVEQSRFDRGSDDEYSEEFDRQEPSRKQRRDSHDGFPPFTGLSKTVAIKISKSVGVSSIASDVHETLKSLSGTFVHNILSEAAQSTENTSISSAELEPIVEHHLGRSVEDLDQSFLNSSSFARWVKNIADTLQVGLRNEAILFLQQVVEFYLVELLTNARDVAEQGGRSRVMIKDVQLASRMR